MSDSPTTTTTGLDPVLARIPERWGRAISCGPGWYQLIIDLDAAIAEHLPGYEVHQVKEKFGTLRFYWGTPEGAPVADPTTVAAVRSLVDATEAASAATCEQCGTPGTLRRRTGWYKTLCTPCATAGGYADERAAW